MNWKLLPSKSTNQRPAFLQPCCETRWKVKNAKHRRNLQRKQCCAAGWGLLYLVFRRLMSSRFPESETQNEPELWHNYGTSKENLHFDDAEVNKLFFFFFVAICIFSILRNRKHVLRVSIVLEKLSWKFGETRKSCGNTIWFLQHFCRSPKLVFLWLDRNTVHVFYFLNIESVHSFLIWIFFFPAKAEYFFLPILGWKYFCEYP